MTNSNKNIPGFLSRHRFPSTYHATHVRLKLRSDRIFHSSLSFAESRNVRSSQSKFLLLENQKSPEAVARTRWQARSDTWAEFPSTVFVAGTYCSGQQIRFLRLSGPRSLLGLILSDVSGAFFSNIYHSLASFITSYTIAKLLKADPLEYLDDRKNLRQSKFAWCILTIFWSWAFEGQSHFLFFKWLRIIFNETMSRTPVNLYKKL